MSSEDASTVPLPPIMADPARVFRHVPAEGGKTFKLSELFKEAKRAASAQGAPQIAQESPVELPSPNKAAE